MTLENQSSLIGDGQAEKAPVAQSQPSFRIVFFALMMAMLLAALDQTIVSTALPTIVGELH